MEERRRPCRSRHGRFDHVQLHHTSPALRAGSAPFGRTGLRLARMRAPTAGLIPCSLRLPRRAPPPSVTSGDCARREAGAPDGEFRSSMVKRDSGSRLSQRPVAKRPPAPKVRTVRSRSAPPHVASAALGICALVRAPASGSAGCGLDRTPDPEAPLRLPQRESFRESSSRNLVALRRALVADSLSARSRSDRLR